ncbi:MAG: glycosyltransferase family 2 protein [Gammaproteobacteria bacterium]
MSFNPCALIPVFNHHREMPRLVAALRDAGLPIIVVDDGSNPTTAEALDALATDTTAVMLLRHNHNRGKGAAFLTGLDAAVRANYTHALQIDADGQHDPTQAATLLALAEAEPAALISGTPDYDESVPAIRYYGRWITHLLVWLETGSRALTDSMCGYRVYPVAATLQAFRTQPVGRRMDFDTEIMVRLHLAGTPVRFSPVTVRYPSDGTSNYRLLRDNLRMTWLHLRLLAGLPWRLLHHGKSRRVS